MQEHFCTELFTEPQIAGARAALWRTGSGITGRKSVVWLYAFLRNMQYFSLAFFFACF